MRKTNECVGLPDAARDVQGVDGLLRELERVCRERGLGMENKDLVKFGDYIVFNSKEKIVYIDKEMAGEEDIRACIDHIKKCFPTVYAD